MRIHSHPYVFTKILVNVMNYKAFKTSNNYHEKYTLCDCDYIHYHLGGWFYWISRRMANSHTFSHRDYIHPFKHY